MILQTFLLKPYECNVCCARFTSTYQLTYHQRGQHGIGEPIVCSCGIKFKSLSNLSSHRRKFSHPKARKSGYDRASFDKSFGPSTENKSILNQPADNTHFTVTESVTVGGEIVVPDGKKTCVDINLSNSDSQVIVQSVNMGSNELANQESDINVSTTEENWNTFIVNQDSLKEPLMTEDCKNAFLGTDDRYNNSTELQSFSRRKDHNPRNITQMEPAFSPEHDTFDEEESNQ